METKKANSKAPMTPRKPRDSSKRRKNPKMRRLGEEQPIVVAPPVQVQAPNDHKMAYRILTAIIFLTVAVLSHGFLVGCDKHFQIFANFTAAYRKHYNYIVHGRTDYCSTLLDTVALAREIEKFDIIHQKAALAAMNLALRNTSKLNEIAIVGPSGVGKSLYSSALQANWPWPNNVHSYDWTTYVKDEVEKIHMLRLFAERLTSCGQNLIIIDNLSPCDRDVITIMNDLLAQEAPEGCHVVIIYIFRLNAVRSVTDELLKSLQKINKTKIINFKGFTIDELKGCIEREMRLAEVTLSMSNFEELVKIIDVDRSGCKNVRAKVLAFGN